MAKKLISLERLQTYTDEVLKRIKANSHTHSNKDVLDATTASFTQALLEKLNGIAAGATKVTVDSSLSSDSTNPVQNKIVKAALDGKANSTHTHTKSQITDFPTIPTVNNPTVTITQGGATKGSFTLNQSGATTINLTDSDTTYDVATTSKNGLMSSADKSKLDGIASGANKTVVDSALSSSSTNPVQNKIVQAALDGKVPTSRKVNGKALSADISLTASDVGALASSTRGAANGVAPLNASGTIDATYLPSYVDDVLEGYVSSDLATFYKDSAKTSAYTGETGKIYVDLSNNKTYRWSGSKYVVISETLALGTTSSTAFAGDKGQTAYTHSQSAHAPSNAERNIIVGVQKNGADIAVDSSTRKVNVTVPTKVSELTNDSGYQTSSGTVSKANQLTNTRKIDGVNFNGTADILHYGTCSTAAATAAKVVSISNFNLVTGALAIVKFTVTNTASGPTLNVNSTGAKSIVYRGSAISAGYLAANRIYAFVYTGSNYELLGDIDTNTTYSTGTTSSSGLTKLYTGTGTATDGTMTQNAITTALSGKAASSHNHDSTYLKLAGGTMGGTSTIAWADSGNWGNDNSGVTFPVKRGGLKWTGQSDYVELFAVETANDNLDLALQFGDDNSNGLSIRNKDGTEVSRINANGSFTGTTLWDKISGKPSTYAPSSHTHDDRYYTESEMNTKLATKSDTSHTHDLSTLINNLSTESSTPADADYYVSQYASGGTTTTTYYRRPMSALWAYIKTKLATVATSGSYNDLSNKPTIGNGTVTIKQAGTAKGSFTMNQTGDATIELTDNNTTYSTATASANGLLASSDKVKLNYTNMAYGTCSTAAATSAKVVTISGNSSWSLTVGSVIYVKSTVTNTASNCTLNVNSTGAKSIWYNTSVYTGNSSQICGNANRYIMYMYDGSYWVWMGWSVETNTTYSPASLGGGYGTCTTAAATAAKVATLSSYALVTGGKPCIKFTYAVPASATLNINSQGAKAIYYNGKAITADIIAADDIVTFIYDGSCYHVIAIDKMSKVTQTVENSTDTVPSGAAVTDKLGNYLSYTVLSVIS